MPKAALPRDQQSLRIYQEIEKIRMAWVALIAALSLFTVVTVAFIYALFTLKQAQAPVCITGAIDGMLGFALHKVYTFLFPVLPKDELSAPTTKTIVPSSGVPESPK